MGRHMSFGKDDAKVEAGLQLAHIVLECAGLAFPPIAVAASDAQALYDLYKWLSEHVDDRPGVSRLPGPHLIVKNPAKL